MIIYFNINYRLNQFYKSIIDSTDEWKQWYDSKNPQDLLIPEPYRNVDGIEKLVIIKCIRSDKVITSIQVYMFYKSRLILFDTLIIIYVFI